MIPHLFQHKMLWRVAEYSCGIFALLSTLEMVWEPCLIATHSSSDWSAGLEWRKASSRVLLRGRAVDEFCYGTVDAARNSNSIESPMDVRPSYVT